MQETQETCIWYLSWEDPLEEEMEAHSSILAWKIPWTEEPCGLQWRGQDTVEHDGVTGHTSKKILENLDSSQMLSILYALKCFPRYIDNILSGIK